MNSKRQLLYSTILIFVFLLVINIRQTASHSFSSEPPSEIEFQEMLDEGSSLINQFHDRQNKLNNLVEEYGNSLTGNEENVLNLVTEVKELWKKLKEITSNQTAAYTYCYSCSEKQKQEAYKQDDIVLKLKDEVFVTLFNAKARKCKSEKEAFYESLSKCFEIGGPCPDDHPNQLFYELFGTNDGICDCKDEIGQVFHKQTGECYLLNTQGPCQTGEWLIYNSRLGIEDAVTCESVPDKECKLDGSQVFYKDRCETLGPNIDACGDWGILIRDPNDLGIIICFDPSPDWFPHTVINSSIGNSIPRFSCPAGTKRSQTNQCRPILKHGIKQKRNIL